MFVDALIMGMTYDQFWHNKPSLFFLYLEAYQRKQKENYEAEMMKMNYNAWLNGLYIDYALAVNPSFGKKQKYLDKPIEFKNKEEKLINMSEEDKQKFEEQLAVSTFEQFGKYAKLYNQAFHGGEEEK